MKIRITVKTKNAYREFSSGLKAMKFLKAFKADEIKINNELVSFKDIAELYQLELAEKRHSKAQGL